MMTRTVILFAAFLCALVLSASLPSCVGIDGSHSTTAQPTTGQELIDLKTALDKGVITQAEYDQKRAQIMARP